MTIFGPDTSRWQGDVDWGPVNQAMDFGWAKVSEGPGKGCPDGYISERWGPEKPGMTAAARAGGFLPGGYLFLAEGPGAAQADWFADAAGNMDGFMIAVDVEPRDATGSRPTMAQARACVARLRARYPGHPIGGYIPKWYWGTADTTFVDYLWSSNYVTGGPASPQALYSKVTPGQWAGYGGSPVALLQFTDKAQVPGIAGPCDCSAFRGTAAGLAALALPRGPAVTEDDMIPAYVPPGPGGHPVAISGSPRRLRFFSAASAVVRVDWVGVDGSSSDVVLSRSAGAQGAAVPHGCIAAVVRRVLAGEVTPAKTAGAGDGTEEISFILVT